MGQLWGSLNNNFIDPKRSKMVQNRLKLAQSAHFVRQRGTKYFRPLAQVFKNISVFLYLSIYTDKYKNAHIFLKSFSASLPHKL